eukprot:3536328-Rhodomonas_salina.1
MKEWSKPDHICQVRVASSLPRSQHAQPPFQGRFVPRARLLGVDSASVLVAAYVRLTPCLVLTWRMALPGRVPPHPYALHRWYKPLYSILRAAYSYPVPTCYAVPGTVHPIPSVGSYGVCGPRGEVWGTEMGGVRYWRGGVQRAVLGREMGVGGVQN